MQKQKGFRKFCYFLAFRKSTVLSETIWESDEDEDEDSEVFGGKGEGIGK